MTLSGRKCHIDSTFIELFLSSVENYPDNMAIICDNNSLSYRQLHRRVLMFSQILIDEDIERLLISIPRSTDMIALLLACQLRNIPYIPVDMSSGIDRVQHILKTTGAHALLEFAIEQELLQQGGNYPIFSLDTWRLFIDATDQLSYSQYDIKHMMLDRESTIADTYWIYTSGSMGEPKCVMVGEYGCSNLLHSFSELLAVSDKASWLSSTSIAFDIFYLEYAMPLSVGATLILLTDQHILSSQNIAQQLVKYSPKYYQSTPSMFKCLMPYLPEEYRFQHVLVGGEVLNRNVADFLYQRSTHIYNVYGPTETTVWSSYHIIQHADDICIGQPLHNTDIVLLDEESQYVEVGEEGRICIGGAGLARGYFLNDVLTQQKFQYITTEDGGNEILYDTGDIGYVDGNNLLHYVRRDGDFYKVNGYRVDPIEVKEALETMDGISEAGVVIPTYDGEQYIVGFYKHYSSLDNASIFQHLKSKLSHYLMPHYIFSLKEFPYTVSGKLDSKKLEQKSFELMLTKEEVTTTNIILDENKDPIVVELSKYINVDLLGDDDNIFNHGLTSMSAVLLHIDLVKIIPDIELYQIFDSPTIAGIRSYSHYYSEKL